MRAFNYNFNTAPTDWRRDASLLQTLGVNSVFIGEIDMSQDHTDFMDIFRTFGIYVLVWMPVDTPLRIIAGFENAEWNDDVYAYQTAIIERFAVSSNFLGFVVDDVGIYNGAIEEQLPFVKAAVRDLKRYMRNRNFRNIPVGVRGDNGTMKGLSRADYFQCGNTAVNETVDFWITRDDGRCDPGASDDPQHFSTIISAQMSLHIPLFYQYESCRQGNYSFVDTIYNSNMAALWSGGFIGDFSIDFFGRGMCILRISSRLLS